MIHGPHHRNDLCFAALLPFKVELSMFHLIAFTGSKQFTLRGPALSDYMITAKPFPFTLFPVMQLHLRQMNKAGEFADNICQLPPAPRQKGQRKAAWEATVTLRFQKPGSLSSELFRNTCDRQH